MGIESAKYGTDYEGNNSCIRVVVGNLTKLVPLDPDNTDYQEILEWAKIDGNTIAEAD